MRAFQLVVTVGLAFVGTVAGCDCDDGLEELRPSLVVNPDEAVLNGVPVSQDTPIIFTLPNQRTVNLDDVIAVLSEDSDPNFTLVDGEEERVLPGQSGELVVNVRPVVEGTIEATLIVDSADNAVPNHVEVPITVTAINVGLPDIEVDPEEVVFSTIGRTSVGRETVNVKNVGVRDLVLDAVYLRDDSDPEFSLVGAIPPGSPSQNLGPRNANTDITIIFRPQDTERHTATLVIESNDPDEAVVEIPISAQAVECPTAVAELIDAEIQVEPFDTVRLDGRGSFTTAPGTEIAPFPDGYEWTLLVRPVGSTAVLNSTNQDRTDMLVDLAGLYQVQLDVFAVDTTSEGNPPIKSCAPAVVDINVVPADDLHVQLVWDHPRADVDLHMLNDGGQVFTHEGDVYFSNREPLAPDQPGWSTNPDENPRLDVDDPEGYGPENINIKHPAPGSKWTILVHYWNRNATDAVTTATVRVFVYGSQAIELTETFAADQQLWRALELVWGDDPLEPPTMSQLGVVEPFPRPF